MKKTLFNALLCSLLMLSFGGRIHCKAQEGQSTEGKDFWVTFMQADQGSNDLILQLSVSSREDCKVTISNPFTSYSETKDITANKMELITIYHGDSPMASSVRNDMAKTGNVCYAVNSEKVDTCALHVTATANISLFATNYKYATFDATNVLPTASLQDEYIIQTYSPSDHENSASDKSKSQGSHFAVIAAEDNTIIDYCPSVPTDIINSAKSKMEFSGGAGMSDEELKLANYQFGKDTLHSPMLKKGQVYYVWTGKKDNDAGDLSGTYVRARDGKKIAVFQGCPHTNIPYEVRQRDHIFSQAMPTKYWGNTFVLTASKNRAADIIRILALNDETEVRINGELVHKFDFSTETKHYWEFEIGPSGAYAKDGSCILTTSCPCAVHLFITSQVHRDSNNKNGDPAMMWINPIEQQIDQVTFATYQSLGKDGKGTDRTTYHYTNIVTDQPKNMFLDGESIESEFKPVSGSSTYYYAQVSLGNDAKSHTLKSTKSNFIAHVYGFTQNESYGYSAGGATKALTQYITINGQIFTPDSENTLCGTSEIEFACHPDYEYKKIEWYFGDGASDLTNTDSVAHAYTESGVYHAYVLIYRESSNLCVGENAVDSVPVRVAIGNFKIEVKDTEIPSCIMRGDESDIKIYLDNPGKVPLRGDSVTLVFDQVTKNAGFKEDEMRIVGDTMLVIHVPGTATDKTDYSIHLRIGSECAESVLEKDIEFQMIYDVSLLAQRFDYTLGVAKDSFPNQTLSNFVWYHNGDSIPGEHAPVLLLDKENPDNKGVFTVCFDIERPGKEKYRYCTCPESFDAAENAKKETFNDADNMTVSAVYAVSNGSVYVNADYKGQTDIECYAQWITVDGQIYQDLKFTIPDGGCVISAPTDKGLYLLRVVTDKESRSFKFIINQ